MASRPAVLHPRLPLEIPSKLRELLKLGETETHYSVQTLSGATLLFSKGAIQYPRELPCGILDDGKDTTEERRREREWELAHDERKFGTSRDK